MVTRPSHPQLVIEFLRHGAVVERTRADEGRQAVLRALGLILGRPTLLPGDVLRVLAEPAGDDE